MEEDKRGEQNGAENVAKTESRKVILGQGFSGQNCPVLKGKVQQNINSS